mgnify:CR=1 FL=1
MTESPRILLVVAPYYKHITDQMVEGAIRHLTIEGATHEVVEVAGAFELPFAIATAHEAGSYDGYIALGCVIRGETSHTTTSATRFHEPARTWRQTAAWSSASAC